MSNDKEGTNNHPIWNRPNLSEEELKTVLSNPESTRFLDYAADLLESTKDLNQVTEYIKPETLAKNYDRIRKRFSSSKNTAPFKRHWDETIEVLKSELNVQTDSEDKSDNSRSFEAIKLGQRLRKLRKAEDLSQVDVAKKLNWSQQAISNLENGKTNVSFDRITNYLNALGYKPDLVIEPDNDLKEMIRIDVESILAEMNLSDELRRLTEFALMNLVDDVIKKTDANTKNKIYSKLKELKAVFKADLTPSVYSFLLGNGLDEELRKHEIQMTVLENKVKKVINRLNQTQKS